MNLTRGVLLGLITVTIAACDLVVNPGETITVGDGGSVFATETLNAVRVRPGGTLVVEDANLFGLGRTAMELPEMGQPFPELGTAVMADHATVRVLGGSVTGGNILFQLPPLAQFSGSAPSKAGSAIVAEGSVIEIQGGRLQASGVFGFMNMTDIVRYGFAPAVAATQSVVRIRGGVLTGGDRPPIPQNPGGYGALEAIDSDVEITGGEFQGSVRLLSSQSRITGGSFPFFGPVLGGIRPRFGQALTVATAEGLPPGCTEIHGGSFATVNVFGEGEQLFIFAANAGVGGPVDPFIGALSVVFADGSESFFPLRIGVGARVELRVPGQAGCGQP